MTVYSVEPHGDGSFDIKIISGNGARQTMLGFASAAEAEVWIEHNKRHHEETVHEDDRPISDDELSLLK